MRGKTESLLGTMEILIASMTMGYTINYLVSMNADNWIQFHDQALFHYWMVVDTLLMLMTIAYTYTAKYLQINGELMNNFYSLIFIQKRVMEEE